jgi:hypothetical protein
MKTTLVSILFSLALIFPPFHLDGADQQGHQHMMAGGLPMPDYPSLPEPGKKIPIGSGYYLIYGFDKTPKLGTAIMKVEIFTGEGKRDTSLEVKADADMPSMRGAHATGDRNFMLSNKGVYLLPIPIVMPGDWEVRLTVVKDGKVIFRGRHDFNV